MVHLNECIIDLRQIKDRTGITGEDIAKRLIDCGLHAPTTMKNHKI